MPALIMFAGVWFIASGATAAVYSIVATVQKGRAK